MSIVIRNASITDVEEIFNIYIPYIKDTVVTFEYDIPPFEVFMKRFVDVTSKDAWIVCVVDGKIAGYAYAAPPFERAAFKWNTEFSVYINPKYHSMHIGTALYNCLLDIAKLQGYYNIYSLIEAGNAVSIKMHENMGFSEVTTMNNIGYKLDKWCDLTWLLLQIHEYDSNPVPPKSFSEIEVTLLELIYDKHSQFIKY